MKNIIFLAVVLLLIACKHTPTEPVTEEGGAEVYGASLTDAPIKKVSEVLSMLETNEVVEPVTVEATVESVCQAKGCWMNLYEDGSEDKMFFVKFKDYGFFMPMDIAGRKVVVQGKAYKELTSVDELRHYAEDEGKTEEEVAAITEPVEEYKFMATGVRLLP